MNEKLLASILTIMTNIDTSLSESFYDAVLKRLVSLGYSLKEDDGWALCFAMQKVENHIKNSCNTTSIPDGLFNVAVDMVCGEFLFAKKQTGQLELGDLDLTGAITSIKEGDTQVNFGGSSDESNFNQMLDYLMHHGEGDFVCYRKIRW
ncbi:MAG: hypothetical protein O0V67_07270 [Methanocorpusculum sp.]|nr:hypothetical protein [Methanocorpusculum sp.]